MHIYICYIYACIYIYNTYVYIYIYIHIPLQKRHKIIVHSVQVILLLPPTPPNSPNQTALL